MRRTSLVTMLATIGCALGGCEDGKEKATAAKQDLAAKSEELGKRATSVASELADKATDTAGDLGDAASRQLERALAAGKRAKGELDKVYQSKSDYDLTVDDGSSADAASHAAHLARMPSVTIGDVRVGYEEDAARSLRGTTYAKHFRASWRRDGKIVRVSYYTKESIDAVAFVALLRKLVPAIETVLR